MSTVSPSIQNAIGIITDARMDCGKLRLGDDLDGEIISQDLRRLNKLVNLWMTQGLKLWLIQDIALTLVPPLPGNIGVPLYTLGPTGTVVMPKPARIPVGAYYLYNDGNQYPLVPMSYQEYKSLSQLTQPGAVNSYAVDKQQNTLNVYLWNPPDSFAASGGTVHLLLEQQVTNFVGITDTMNFPIEWSLALEWALADLLSVGQPASIIARCAANAEKYKQMLEDWDVEDADTMMQMDSRFYQNEGRFK